MIDRDRVEGLKQMYRKYKRMGFPKAAQRTLDRLVELGVSNEEITKLRLED